MLQFLVKEFGAFLFYCVLAGKNITMKHSLFIAILLAAVSGCGFLDTGDTRFNIPRSGTILPEPARDAPDKDSPGGSTADTSVFLTAVDIVKLNAELAEIVERENVLRAEIDKIIAEIE